MGKSQAPQPPPDDEFAALDNPAESATAAPAPEAAPPPAEPTPEVAAAEASEVVVGSSAPNKQPAAWRVLNTKRVTIRSNVVILKPGRVFREDHYDAGFIDQLKAGGVEFERVS